MKNLRSYNTPQEIKEFVLSILKTKEMRRAFQTQPHLIRILELYAQAPRLTFEASDDVIERGNFTSWYNALAIREYENPAVNDLYYLHEISHIATMPYVSPPPSFESWKAKMFRNELETSVLSEASIYFLCPQLRALSFKGEIWVDRFLRTMKSEAIDKVLVKLVDRRERVQRNPDKNDSQEMRIASYENQNEEWARIWKSKYVSIEEHMAEFYELAKRNSDEAARMHRDWIEKEIGIGGKPYPFPAQVEKFAEYCASDKTATIPEELNLKKSV